jgi:2-iminobutanoate/2-iminopropanoate deaminase
MSQERRVVNDSLSPGGPFSTAVSASGLVFVSGLPGSVEDGKLTGSDVQTQTRRVLDRLRGVLEQAGSSLAQVVSVQVYLKRASDFEAMNTVYRTYFADAPPARTTVVTDLTSGALIAMSAIAVPAGAPRETLHPAGWVKSPRPYSYIVRAGRLVFLAGLVSRRGTDDSVVPGPVALQTQTILDNAGVLLKTAGLTYEHVVAARVFITDDSYFEAMNAEYAKYFPSNPPARATAVTELMGVDAAVEISIIASTDEKRVMGAAVSPSLPLSSAIRAGEFVFLSGVLGNADNKATDVSAQSREVFDRVHRTLDGAGLSFSHVVDATVYLPDVSQQPRVNQICAELFPTDPPCCTVVGARLVTRAGLVEVIVTASAR